MSNFNKSHIIEEITLESPDKNKSVDLRRACGDINYFEGLFESTLYLTVDIVESAGVYSSFPVRGGERVKIKIRHDSGNLDATTEIQLFVYKISNLIQQNNKESFTLHLASKELFINETTFLYRKYTGKISDTVKTILQKEIKTDRIGKIDPTTNTYDFMGNYKKPFQTMIWLSAKSIGTIQNKKTAGSAGFLFFQNRSGFHFRSIDELFNQLNTTDKYFTYYQSHVTEFGSKDNNFKILSDPIWSQTSEIIQDLKIGKYSSSNFFYDIITRKPEFHKYTLEQSLPLFKDRLSGQAENEVIPENLQGKPSRIMLKVIDNGTLSSAGDLKTKQDQPFYQSQSIMRYNLLFGTTLNITVPCNLSLQCGDVVKLEFPDTSNPKYSRNDLNVSGLYLIKELRHIFMTGKERTSLSLVRDSFGEKL